MNYFLVLIIGWFGVVGIAAVPISYNNYGSSSSYQREGYSSKGTIIGLSRGIEIGRNYGDDNRKFGGYLESRKGGYLESSSGEGKASYGGYSFGSIGSYDGGAKASYNLEKANDQRGYSFSSIGSYDSGAKARYNLETGDDQLGYSFSSIGSYDGGSKARYNLEKADDQRGYSYGSYDGGSQISSLGKNDDQYGYSFGGSLDGGGLKIDSLSLGRGDDYGSYGDSLKINSAADNQKYSIGGYSSRSSQGDDYGKKYSSIGFTGSDFHTPVDTKHEEIVHLKAYPQYDYKYSVADEKTKDYKNQHEIRDGYKVKGSYSLLEPDHKTIRQVDYISDKKQGFIAKVTLKQHYA